MDELRIETFHCDCKDGALEYAQEDHKSGIDLTISEAFVPLIRRRCL